MDLNFSTADTAKLATMPVPEFAEDVTKPVEGAPAADPDTGDLPESDASKIAKQAVEGAPAGVAKKDLEATIAAETAVEAERTSGEADKEHNFALLRAAKKRLEEELEEARRLLNEKTTADVPKLEAPPDLATLDGHIAKVRAEAKRLAEEWPDMGLDTAHTANADFMQGVRDRIARDEQAIKDYQEAERKRAEGDALDAVAVAQEKAEALIASDPVLSHWKDKDQKSYDLAAEQDAVLRAQPAWQGVPLEKRFAAVIELVKAINPEASLPTAGAPAADPAKDQGKPGAPKPAAAKGKEPAAPIRSLSDVPGGIPAAASELENLSELSPAVIGNKFLKMSHEQQDAYISSLAG